MSFPTRFRALARVVGFIAAGGGASGHSMAGGLELGPLIAGKSSYVNGTFVSTDYVYDDRGPNTDITAGGDASYPLGLENTADIVQVQIDNDDDAVTLRVILQTLIDANIPQVGFVLDTDASPRTGAATIPGGAWEPATPLGAELLVTASAGNAEVLAWNGTDWEPVAILAADIRPADNSISVALPKTLVDPSTGKWRAFAIAGLAQSSFLAGGTIYDLAFLLAETISDRETMIADSIQAALVTGETAMWQDHRQAAVLAGELDAAEAAAVIDFGRMQAGETELATADAPGWHTFLFRSALELGEGIDSETGVFGSSTFSTRVYKGPYQPYLVHRNAKVSDPHPLVVFLHGAGTTHTMNTYWFENADGGPILDFPAVTVFPLARGETLGYQGIAEFDVLEVLADARQRFNVDPERVVLAGISMGGIGTYKLASLYPDRFSTAISHVGHGSAVHDLIENLVNLPFRASNGMLDYLVMANTFLPDRERGLELGYDFRFFDVIDGHHQIHPHLANCLYLNGVSRTRVIDPPRVRYTVEPGRFMFDPQTGLDLTYDSAYWVSDIRVRSGAVRGVVDATSLARADRTTTTRVVDTARLASGRDFCGVNPDVQLTTSPEGASSWRERSIVHSPGLPQPTSNALRLELAEVEALTLDTRRMSLSSETPLTLKVTGDGQVALTLLGNWRGRVNLRKGETEQPYVIANSDGSLTLIEDFSGVHEYRLTPAGLEKK